MGPLAILCSALLAAPASAGGASWRSEPWAMFPIQQRGPILKPTRGHRLAQAGNALTAVPFAHVALPRLAYHGGRVIERINVVPVYWSRVDPALKDRLDAWYGGIVSSELFDWLREYDTDIAGVEGRPGTNQHIGRGTAVPGIVIQPATAATNVTDRTVVEELSRNIRNGTLPPNVADTVYALHFPPGIAITVTGGFQSCREFCAYHYSTELDGRQVVFSVMPDHGEANCRTGCGEGDAFDNLCASASHELIEIVTDPEVALRRAGECGTGWCDPAEPDHATSHGEIGDICGDSPENITLGAITTAGGARLVAQRVWSNRYAACMLLERDAFSVLVEPASQRITGPGTYSFRVRTTVPQGGPADVKIGLYKLPSGISASIVPRTIPAGGEATLSLTVSQVAAPLVTFGVYAESGRTQAMAVASLAADDFEVTPGPLVRLEAGGSATATIDTRDLSGNAPQTLGIELPSKPPGVTMQGRPTVVAGQRAEVTVSAAVGSPSVVRGALNFALSNGVTTHIAAVPLDLEGDDFTAAAGATEIALPAGGTARYEIRTATRRGTPQQLRLSVRSTPVGIEAAVEPRQIQSGGTAQVTLRSTSAPGSAGGPIVITVVGAVVSTEVTLIANLRAGGCATLAARAGTGAGGEAGPAGWLAAVLVALSALAQRRRRPAM